MSAISSAQPQFLAGAPGEEIARFPFEALAPQDIAWDGEIYYVTTFLDGKIHRYSADLKTALDPFESPFETALGLTGIAYNEDPLKPRLWVLEPLSREIREIDLEGGRTGREIAPLFHPVVNPGAQPIPRGMAFDPGGDGREGTLYIAESLGSLIYEVDLEGTVLRWMPHPDDPDGFPGRGASAPLYDVSPIHDGLGNLTGIYATGGRGRTEWIRRLNEDGVYTGFSIPLARAGGTVAGFLVKEFVTSDGRRIEPALIAAIESSAELVVLDGAEMPIGEIHGVAGSVDDGGNVQVTWTSGSPYERVELYRDCRLRATFVGDPGSFRDEGLAPGVYRYRLRGFAGGQSTESAECTVVVGGGRVLGSAEYDGRQPVDLAYDEDGFLYVSDLFENKVYIYDIAFRLQGEIPLEFLPAGEKITGIAFSPEMASLFVYGSETNTVVQVDLGGTPVRLIKVSLPNDPQDPLDKPVVAGMTFDPRGGPQGAGALWFVELRRAVVYAIDLEGHILASFLHPVAVQAPVPPRSAVFNFLGGISEAPGPGFQALDLTSGTVFERDVKRIIRVDIASGKAIPGLELPLDGQDLEAPSTFVGIQHGRRADGTPTLYAVAAAGRNSRLLEIDPTLPDPRPITGLRARQRDRSNEVALTFQVSDSYQSILVDRDCTPLARLDEGEFSTGTVEFIDRRVPPGLHRYDVRGVKNGVETAPAAVEVTSGPGAILSRGFAHPMVSPTQLSRDPTDGTFLAASNSTGQARNIFRYRPDLSFEGALTDVIPAPWEVATLAARPDAAEGSLTHVIAWQKVNQVGGEQSFPMYVLTRGGKIIAEFPVDPPRPPNGFLKYPTGLAWDEREGVFYYLERNSDTIVRMDIQGKTLALIRHPAPPAQSYVFNLGLSIDAENHTILVTGAGPEDHRITRAIQLTISGRLTGLELPLGNLGLNPLTGIAVDGSDLIVTGFGAAAELIRVQAFHPLPPPADLACSVVGQGTRLTWRPAQGLEAVSVLRNGVPVAVLPGDASAFDDRDPERDRPLVYSVAGRIGEREGKNAVCELPPLGRGFIRGDANSSGVLDLTDAIVVLSYLFLGGPPPACDDAADADDSGDISLTDPIRILGHLYLGEGWLPLPYPEAGRDPTPDSLSCL